MLETIWFVIWGILWAIYFVLDGFDLGLGTIMPAVAKNETEKRTVLNSMGPFWDGNEVWLITAGGVTFAAFPITYAVLFSGLYTALMLLLIALIIRGVALEFRSKIESPTWQRIWERAFIVSSFVPALLLGVAFANIFQGLAIDSQNIVQGGLLGLLNPYGILGGVLFVLLFALHGSLWLGIKAQGELQQRAARLARGLWPVVVFAVLLFLVFSAATTQLFGNYLQTPWLMLIFVLPIGGLFGLRVFLGARQWWYAWLASAATIAGTTLFGIIGNYPALLPSKLNPAHSLTITNSSSSPLTLKIMLGVALVFVPIVMAYQFWAYRLFRHPVTSEDLASDEAY
ncbi:MAG: cytochrome d ubiquinol oxidase subunit II [Thermodesulfobacteriota bacterium]